MNEPQIKQEQNAIKVETCVDVVDFVKTENEESEVSEQQFLGNVFFSLQQGTNSCDISETLPEMPSLVENTAMTCNSNSTCVSSFGLAQANSVFGKI